MPDDTLPGHARAVVVGAGIVGCSVAYHLTKLGWRDIVVVDQGPLFETGGSTSHAPGLVFQINPSKTMTSFASYSVDLWSRLGLDGVPCAKAVGSMEVAWTPERLEDLKRKVGLGLSWGVEAHMLDAAETRGLFPMLSDRVLGAMYVPSDIQTRATRPAEAMAREAERNGAAFYGNVKVTGFGIDRRARHDCPHRPRGHRDGARGLRRRHLGAQTVRSGRRAHTAVADAAHLRGHHPVGRAGWRGRGNFLAVRAPPGQVHVLPAGGRGDWDRVVPARTPPCGGRRHSGTLGGSHWSGRDALYARPLPERDDGGAGGNAQRRGRGPDAQIQRSVLVHHRRLPRAWGIAPGARLLVGAGRVVNPRRRRRQGGRRVDRERRAGRRPPRMRHQALPPARAQPTVRPGARRSAVPRGVRHHPPAAADGAVRETSV